MATIKRAKNWVMYSLALFIAGTFSLFGRSAPSWAQEAKRDRSSTIFQTEMQRTAQKGTDADKYMAKPGIMPVDKYMAKPGIMPTDKYMAKPGIMPSDKYESALVVDLVDAGVLEKLRSHTTQALEKLKGDEMPTTEELLLMNIEILKLEVEALKAEIKELQTGIE